MLTTRADRALCATLAGSPRRLRVLLQTSAAAYLGFMDDDDGDAGVRNDGADPCVVLVDDGGIVVPDAVRLPPGLTGRRLLAPHLDGGAPLVVGGGRVRCGSREVAVRADLDLRIGALPAAASSWAITQIADVLRTAAPRSLRPVDRPHRSARARSASAASAAAPVGSGTRVNPAAGVGPWPTITHQWSSGFADPATLVTDAPGLIGRGPGVTPSGDDILAGAILAHTALGTPGIGAAAARIVQLSAGRTTAAAVTSTRGAADGRAAEPLRRALVALAAGGDAGPELRSVLALGHTSGADLLRGLHDALIATTHVAAERKVS